MSNHVDTSGKLLKAFGGGLLSEIYLYQPPAVVAAIHDVVDSVNRGAKLPER